MLIGLFACLVALVSPHIDRFFISLPLAIENPSTMELALIGVGTLAVYWAVTRSRQPDKDPTAGALHTPTAEEAASRTDQASRDAA